jgi:hypothetical protein
MSKDEEIATKIAAIIPISFLDKMHLTYSRTDRVDERDMIEEFLLNLEAESYENIFLIWSRDTYLEAQEKVRKICDAILIALSSLDSSQGVKNFTFQ